MTSHIRRNITLIAALVTGVGSGSLCGEVGSIRLNLAVVATPSASYVSGDTTLKALNDGSDPRSSRDNRRGSYGNWNRTGTQWVQYDWSQPISTRSMEVYWWADGAGIKAPKACRLLYWDGNAFVPVANPSGFDVETNKYNSGTFDEVTTSKVRLEMDSDGTFSTGILEWKVFDSGKSPKFPPMVDAGVDRVLVVGGQTYLSGKVKTLQGGSDGVQLAWTQESGPGKVRFADPKIASTTAAVSKPGTYVLKLTAMEGKLSGSSTLTFKAEPPPPAVPLTPLEPAPYKVNSPLWNGRVKTLIVNWIPHCIEKISDSNVREGGINNFEEAAKKLQGKPHAEHRGYVFANAWVHNTVEAICLALMVDPQGDKELIQAQQQMKATLEDWIPKILAAQENDGYLQTAYTLSGRQRWTNKDDHEGYTAGYFIESAIAHYLLTDKKDPRMYNAARKLADCWLANIGPAPKRAWYDGHQELEQAMVRFGRFVNEVEGGKSGEKYIQFAKFLLDSRRDGHEYDQSHLPVIQQYEAVGHAVRAVYSYSGMTGVALETGDRDYQSAVLSLCDNIVNRKYYITGGVGSGETSEGFGPNYSLRNNAYCESCSSCGEIFFQHKLNLMYGDAKYADLYEETLYNALLGSVDLPAKNFYYQNPLDARGLRYAWHGCPCCVGNIPKTLLMMPTWAYATSPKAVWVNLFFGSTVRVPGVAGTTVEMVQTTDYPWKGGVAITVNPTAPKRFTINLRVPNRQVSALYTAMPSAEGVLSLSVNGKSVKPEIQNGYVSLNRAWKAGDKIEMALPMPVQRVKACEKINADAGRVALRYGPLVYNVEQVDQDINGVLSPNSPLTTEWKGDLLEGVVVVKGTFADGQPFMAIPNYARCNREDAGAGGSEARGRGRAPASIVWVKDR